MQKLLTLTADGLMFAALVAGCATTSGIEATGKTAYSDEGARTLSQQVLIQNTSLGSDIAVTALQSDRVGDMMRAQATLTSKTSSTLKVQYRFVWFSAAGMELNSNSAWKPLIVYGKESKTIQGVAPDPRAASFKLAIRNAED